MITNLQVLRALAALAVAFYHTRFQVGGVGTDFFGVCVFFVISGFIMTHISRSSVDLFMTKRLVRIVPLYWIVTIFFLLWNNLGFANPLYTFPLFSNWIANDPHQLLVWFGANNGLGDATLQSNLLKDLLFLPYKNHAGDMHPILGVGWTLNLEMFFYVLFAAALHLSQRWAPLFVVLALMAMKLTAIVFDDGFGILSFYSHPYTFCFVLGIGVFYVWRFIAAAAVTWNRRLMTAIAVAFAAWYGAFCFQLFTFDAPGSVLHLTIAFLACGMVVALALAMHSAGVRCNSRWLVLVGNASYALYLTHPIVVETIGNLGQRWGWLDISRSAPGMVLTLAVSVVVAIAVYAFVEQPLLSVLRRKLEGSGGAKSRATA
ncbi:acyltransferase family protein [Cupriavidus sp. IDO]|uniref:acyltransferase family protein n=1 Tax=Cupriavidus sp. IDO TaxID=1539142 RepID=UPI0005796111|nr:acyltransferase [Cupriavidus sp. IDO]KWR88756.1 hypothetical protein RM96_17735 [Cupriavidus sp. IDO]